MSTKRTSIMCYSFLMLMLIIMNGIHAREKVDGQIRVSAFNNPLANIPGVAIQPVGIFEKEMLDLFAKNLNFNYTIHVPNDVLETGELLSNGSWSGIMGQFQRKEIDMSIYLSSPSLMRSVFVDFTFAMISQDVLVMMPFPEKVNPKTALFSTYSPTSWTCIAVSTVASMMAVWFMARFQAKIRPDKQVVYRPVKVEVLTMLATAVILSQGRLNHIGGVITTWKPRLILASWLLGLTVVIYAYSTTLISRLTAPEYTFLVTSIGDLGNRDEILPVTVKGAAIHEELAGSPSYPLKTIEKRVHKNPTLMCSSVFDCFGTMLSKPNTVVIMGETFQKWFMKYDLKKTGKCRTYFLPEKLYSRFIAFSIAKHSPLTKIINQELLLWNQAGLPNYWESRYFSKKAVCQLDARKKNVRPIPLKLNQFSSTFFVLGFGSGVSFVVFLLEIFCFALKQR